MIVSSRITHTLASLLEIETLTNSAGVVANQVALCYSDIRYVISSWSYNPRTNMSMAKVTKLSHIEGSSFAILGYSHGQLSIKMVKNNEVVVISYQGPNEIIQWSMEMYNYEQLPDKLRKVLSLPTT